MFEKMLFLLSFWWRQFNTYVKNRCTQKYTETLLRMLFREGLRRLRETIPLRRVFV